MWWFVLAGFIGGILGGMGMGGGTLLIPILTIFLSVAQKEAQGINLIAFIPMAIIALVIHFKNKLVKVKDVLYIIIPAAATSVLFSLLSNNMSNNSLQKYFGIFLIVLGGLQIGLELRKLMKRDN